MKNTWAKVTLGDILLPMVSTNPRIKPLETFQYVDVSSVSNKSFAIERTQTILGKDAPSRARRVINNGDVLFATVRPTLRRIAIVPQSLDGQICSTGYFVMKPGESVTSGFLFYLLQSTMFIRKMRRLQRGASYPAVSDGDVRSHIIDLPPVAEQKRIVSLLDNSFDEVRKIKEICARNSSVADELQTNLLHRAITGEL